MENNGPRIVTPVPPEDVTRGDGADITEFIETFCSVTQDTFAGRAGAPMRLRPWQRALVGDVFARRPDGRRRHRVALVGMPRKQGKALDVDTPILTEDGWSTMGGIRVGQKVFAPDGSMTNVVAASEVMHGHTCYRVTFSDGRTLVADGGHLWTMRDIFSRQASVTVDTETLRARMLVGNRLTHKERRYSVPVPEPVKLPDAELPIDPYLLGLWLGDGSASKSELTSGDQELPEAFRRAGYKIRHRPPYAYSISGGFLKQLRAVGVLGNKHIPDVYLLAALQQRLSLLQGLMDTDGSAMVHPQGASSSRVEFTSTREVLADGVLWLARSLGWKATLRPGRAKLNGRDCGPRWRVSWTAYRDEQPFRLHRKLANLPCRPVTPQRSRMIKVVAVDPVPSRPVRCIQVSRADGMFLAGKSLVPTHNSGLSAGIALDGLVSVTGAEVYSCAADREQARIVFGHARRMVEHSPELSSRCKVYRDAIDLPTTGSVYKCISSEAYTKEGLSPTLVVFDEVHAQPTDDLWNVMSLAIGARYDPLILGITTAGVKTDITGQDSVCYRLYQYGERVASGEVVDNSFYMAWWGAATGLDYRDPKVWQQANPALGDLLDPEDMASAIGRTPENEFRTKRLNQWVSSTHAWLPAGAWEACLVEREVPAGAEVCLALDGSYNNDSTALVVCQLPGDGNPPHLDVAGLWERPQRADPGWAVPIVDVEQAVRDACRRWRVREVVVDPFRWARSYQILEDEGLPIVEYPQNPARMTPSTQRFYEAVLNRTLSHSGNPSLARHLNNAVLKVDSRGQRLVKETKASPRKIDLAVAAVMAFDRASQADAEYNLLNSIHIG